MDIRKQYGLTEAAVLIFKDANEEVMLGADGKPCTAEIYGPGSRAHMRALARSQGEAMDMIQRKGKMKKSGDEVSRDKAKFAADVTRGFSDNLAKELFPNLTGEQLAIAIYSDPDIGYLLSDQVEVFHREKANFTKASTAT
jgi:hypothetical protein